MTESLPEPSQPGQTPELGWTASHRYVAELDSLALTRVCDTPRAGANSPTAAIPEREVAAWQTLLAAADPRVVEDGIYGGRCPGRNLSRVISEQAEERGTKREQPTLIRARLPYLRALEGLINGRIENAQGRKRKPVTIPRPEVEAWATLLEPVGEMSEDQPGYDILQRVTATITTKAGIL